MEDTMIEDRKEMARLYAEDPAAFDALIERFRHELAESNEREDAITSREMGTKVTPPARGYLRRHSSIAALALGLPKSAVR